MAIYALCLGIATFVEKFYGTEIAKLFFYYSPILFLIQFLLVVNFIVVSARYQLFRKAKLPFVVIHTAFIIILIGALVTHLFGEEGTIHLRENQKVEHMMISTNRGTFMKKLPFTIELEEFILTRYPGSSSPSSFQSIVTIQQEGNTMKKNISMNNVLDLNHYRLFQASYDRDEKGSILSVNKDFWGRNITYAGYLILIIGFVLMFVSSKSRFRTLIKELKTFNSPKAILLVLFFSISIYSGSSNQHDIAHILQTHQVSKEHAAHFGTLPMQPRNGRMQPVNSFSSQILRKLYHADRIGELNSDQFLLSLLTFSDMWMHVSFIDQGNKDIADKYKIGADYCAYSEMFDQNGFYKLEQQVSISHSKSPAERNKFDKDIIKLDEKINTFHLLINHKLLHLFPLKDDPTHKWYASGDDLSNFGSKDSIYIANLMPQYIQSIRNSIKTGNWQKSEEILNIIKAYQTENNTTLEVSPSKLKTEVLFNQLDLFNQCKKVYLISGGLLILLTFINLVKQNRWTTYLRNILYIGIAIAFLFHLAGLALRGYIGGYAPWSNSYETMIYISLISLLGGFIFIRQSQITFSLATLFAGIILFVASLNWLDPQINALVPVLKSPWLMIHVAVIVAAYSFFGISCLLGISNFIMLCINKKDNLTFTISKLSYINEISLWIGLALMTIGTFLGAVWANESWGRYWGWDSKETWALITILVYAIVTHLRLINKWNNPWAFNIASTLAFTAVLMTYFGVNYFLTGLHSYA